MKKNVLLVSLGIACSLGFYACSDDDAGEKKGLIATNEVVHTVGTGYRFTEGPAVDKNGNVYFTDQNDSSIWKWTASTGAMTRFLEGIENAGGANGMAFDKDGNLIACADWKGEVWKINPTNGTHEVLVEGYNDLPLNGPNDVWVNPKTGGMYFTDPMFPRPWWDAEDPRKEGNLGWPPTKSPQAPNGGKGGHIYYLAPGATELVRVSTMAGWDADSWPNGVVGTPDGKKLYVNKWAGDNMGGTWVFDIGTDGTLSNMTKFLEMGGDGMSMDEKGNIYISNGFGVVVFDKKGTELLRIPVGPGGATNNVFAGADNKTLFITGPVTEANTLQMNVKGVEKF